MGAEKPGEMDYPELTHLFQELTKIKAKFQWTETMEKHFKIIKDRLCSDRVLVPFDIKRKCRVYCDASPFGTQATVAQR